MVFRKGRAERRPMVFRWGASGAPPNGVSEGAGEAPTIGFSGGASGAPLNGLPVGASGAPPNDVPGISRRGLRGAAGVYPHCSRRGARIAARGVWSLGKAVGPYCPHVSPEVPAWLESETGELGLRS
jgi:hypothetical protein